MLIQRAYKTELRPTQAQRQEFIRTCGCARFAFNFALGRKIEHYEATGETLSYAAVDAEFNRLKKTDFTWANEVTKWAHGNAIRDCESAFKNFFRRLKNGEKPGFPKFKSRHKVTPKFRVAGEVLKVEKQRIRLPKIGWVRLKRLGYIPVVGVKLNSATVSQRAGRWFVSVQVEEDIAVPENQGPAVGIDLGLKSFAVGSDGSRLEPPKPLAKSMKKLQRLQRQASRKVNGSNNRAKANEKVAKLHFRVACQRADFLHKASHRYATFFGLVCIETLNVAGMVKNHCLSRSISDSGWSEFARQLGYKCQWYGSELVQADRFYPSTKTCSECGGVQTEMPLSVRKWTCPCGAVHDRDGNAARNLMNYGRAVVTARTGPKGRTPVEIPVGESRKQECIPQAE